MKIHELKTDQQIFNEVTEGRKKFEYRKNDRDFKIGDLLLLKQTSWVTGEETGRCVIAKVTYLLQGKYGVPEGYCVMSIDLVKMEGSDYA